MDGELTISSSLQSVISSADIISIESSVESFDEAYDRIVELTHDRQPEDASAETLFNDPRVDINAQNADINAPGAKIYAPSAEIETQSADINTKSADINTQSADMNTKSAEVNAQTAGINSVSAQINTANTHVHISEDILSQALAKILRPTQNINNCLTANGKMIFAGICMVLVISVSIIVVHLSYPSTTGNYCQTLGLVLRLKS